MTQRLLNSSVTSRWIALATLATVAAAVAMASTAHAQQAQQNAPVQSTMQAFVVDYDDDGEELLLPASTVEPNQTIEWKVVYSNVTAQPQRNLVVTVPVPPGTSYVDETARADTPANVTVSIDNGQSFAVPPITRQRRNAAGQSVTETVPASEYTNIRWSAEDALRGFSNQTFYYRVKVD